jgi:hypothetical protein
MAIVNPSPNAFEIMRLKQPYVARDNIFARMLTKATGMAILNNRDNRQNILLAPKEVCMQIVAVYLGKEPSLIHSELGQAFNVSYGETLLIRTLKDQLCITQSYPAKVSKPNYRPLKSSSLIIDRYYRHIQRVSSRISVSGDTINRVSQLITRYGNVDGLSGNSNNEENIKVKTGYNQVVNTILNDLNELFAVQAGLAKESMIKGINDEAIMTIMLNSMPIALYKTIETHTTDLLISGNIRDFQSSMQMQRNIAKLYVKHSLDYIYIMAKNPHEFLLELVQLGKACVQNVDENIPQSMVLNVDTGSLKPLGGIILVTQQVFTYIKRYLQTMTSNGILFSVKPVFFKPIDCLNDEARILYTAYKEIDVRFMSNALQSLINNYKGDKSLSNFINTAKGEGFVELTEKGSKLLQSSVVNPKIRERFVFDYHRLEKRGLFFDYDSESYAIYPVREQAPCDNTDYYGRTPALTSTHNVLFHVPVGDIMYDEDLSRWLQMVVNGDKSFYQHSDPSERHILKAVYCSTPKVFCQEFLFSSDQALTVFLDPFLYNIEPLIDCLNINFTNSLREKTPVGIRKIFNNKQASARQRTELQKTYFDNSSISGEALSDKGISALAALTSIELHPFFSIEFDERNNIFCSNIRNTFIEIPLYALKPAAVLTRGLFFLSHNFPATKLEELNKNLIVKMEEVDFTTESEVTVDDCKIWFTDFTNSLKKTFGFNRLSSKDLNILHRDEGKLNLFYKYVYLPVITNGSFYIQHKKEENKENITFNVPLDLCKAFPSDVLFKNSNIATAAINTKWIILQNLPPIGKMACLYMYYMYITPETIKAQIQASCPIGFAVDYLYGYKVNSEEMVFTKPHACEMILTPGGVDENKTNDDSLDLFIKTDIWTTKNTISSAALSVPCVFPNQKVIQNPTSNPIKPKISRDYLYMSTLNSKKLIFEHNSEVIKNQLSNPIRTPDVYTTMMRQSSTNYEEWIPIIRPIRNPSSDIMNPLGRNRFYNVPSSQSAETGWIMFYNAVNPTTNPYASEFGSLYQLRFTPNNTNMKLYKSENHPLNSAHNFVFRTLYCSDDNNNNNKKCLTTEILQDMYNFAFLPEILKPGEKLDVATSLSTKMETQLNNVFESNPYSYNNQNIREVDIPTAMGYSVPFRCWTVGALEKINKQGDKRTYLYNNEYYIKSPYHF